jgi:uncharacterized protein (TIGR01777 family)
MITAWAMLYVRMNVGITGASGFIGCRLTERLRKHGHTSTAISLRSAPKPEDLAGCDAVVHLAGEPVSQRWTAAARGRILESREQGTRRLVDAMRNHPPNVLVSASAVGYYGSRGDEILTEQSSPAPDFLGQIAQAWEREALEAEKLGTRVVRLRIAVVLGSGGGALARMLLPFRLGVGGRLGTGRQWMSWIHIDDLCDLILFVLRESTLRGVLNATSPHPATNTQFTQALAHALHRPAFLSVPAFALKLALGDMSEVVLASQRAIPQAALRSGFEFRYPDLAGALLQICGS